MNKKVACSNRKKLPNARIEQFAGAEALRIESNSKCRTKIHKAFGLLCSPDAEPYLP